MSELQSGQPQQDEPAYSRSSTTQRPAEDSGQNCDPCVDAIACAGEDILDTLNELTGGHLLEHCQSRD